MAPALAALAYLASYGARTPFLALRSLGRVRNLALVLVPAAAMGAVALALAGRVDRDVSAGALLLVAVPAPLAAPGLVGRMRGRADLAGALVLGSVLFSLAIGSVTGDLASGAAVAGLEAYAIGALVANGLPPLRDLVLVPLRWVGWAALAAVLLIAALSGPRIDAAAIIAALALISAGTVSAVAVALLTGRDLRAAIGGAGLRDPVLAIGLALATSPAALSVPVAYAVFCLVLAALALIRR